MRSSRSFCLLVFLLLSPFVFLAAEGKDVNYTEGSVEEDGKGFLEFKLVEGKTDKAKCKLVTHDADKLNFTVAIPNTCTVRDETLFFSYGSCNASIARRSDNFTTYISGTKLYFDAKSKVDFFLNQTNACINGTNAGDNREHDDKLLSCKVNTSAYIPDRFLIDFSFWTDALLDCNVSIKFNNSNYQKYAPSTTMTPLIVPSESLALSSTSVTLIVVGAVLGFVLIILLIGTAICCCCLKKRDRRSEMSAAADNEAVLATCISTEDEQSVSVDKAQLHSVTCISKSNEKDGTANRRNRNLPPPSSAENQKTSSADGKPEGYDVDKAVHGALGMHADFVEMRKEHENRKQKPSRDVKTEKATTEKTAAIAPSMMQSLKLATLPSPKKKQKQDDLEGHLKPLPPKEKGKLDATQEASIEKQKKV